MRGGEGGLWIPSGEGGGGGLCLSGGGGGLFTNGGTLGALGAFGARGGGGGGEGEGGGGGGGGGLGLGGSGGESGGAGGLREVKLEGQQRPFMFSMETMHWFPFLQKDERVLQGAWRLIHTILPSTCLKGMLLLNWI